MAKKFLVPLDLSKQELLNARIQNLTSPPSAPVTGQEYFDTTLGKFGVFNGTTWDYMGTSTSTGDVSSNTAISVDGEAAVFSGTGGKTLKRATGTGVAKLTNGVLGLATPSTDYAPATTGTSILKANGTGGFAPAAVADYPILNQNTTGTASNVTGIVAVANGGIGSSTPAGARTNLGLVIGTDVLAPNGSGAALTGITQGQVANLVSDLALKAPLASPTFTGSVTVPTPVNTSDAANKGYVDNAVQGLSWKQAVRAATTTNITLTGTQTIDGVALAVGDRVLVKNQTTGSANGIYVVATGTWPRSTDADSSAEISGTTVYVMEGTSNGDTAWTLTTDSPTLGTTSLVFGLINGGAVPTASTTVAGKVELATQAEAQAKTDATVALTPASVADFARKFTGLIGDGTATTIPVTHGLGSQFVTAQIYDATTNRMVECDVDLTSATQTSFVFSVAPTINQYRVVITG